MLEGHWGNPRFCVPTLSQTRIVWHCIHVHTKAQVRERDGSPLPFESGTLGVASKLVLQAIVSPKLCHKGIASRSDSS